MKRCTLVGLVLVVFGQAPPAGESPDIVALLGPKDAKPEMVRDERWRPAIGDRCTTREATAGSERERDIREYMKYDRANDQTGKRKMLEAGRVVALSRGTSLLILQLAETDPFAAAELSPLEIRVLDGPFREAKLFIAASTVERLIPKRRPEFFRIKRGIGKRASSMLNLFKRPPGGVLDAEDLLSAGQRAEKRTDFPAAVSAYWFTMIDFRDSPEAAKAARRLRAMGFTKKEDGEYELTLK